MTDLSLENVIDVFTHRKPGVVGKHKSFSVLMPLVIRGGQVHVLFEMRSSKLDTQPGEVCFPGGAMEGIETPLQGAVRETMEELGLERSQVKVINKLDTLQSHANLSVYCYLGMLEVTCMDGIPEDEPNVTYCFNVSKNEVAEVFTVPLKFFVENEPEIEWVEVVQIPPEDFPYEKVNSPKAYEWRTGSVDVPIYMYGHYPIWGMTARMVHNFVDILEGRKK